MRLKRYSITACLIALLLAGCVSWLITAALPKMDGEILLPGLERNVVVNFDQFANPTIAATSKADAYFALGYLTAQERIFQMDLMRRKISGRLAEVFGQKALGSDVSNRHLDFERVAAEIVQALTIDQQQLLRSYAKGVNAYLDSVSILPLEFLVLGYTPERWREEDSMLLSLSLFHLLNRNEAEERMISVLGAALPEDVVAFLTPQSDTYNAATLLIEQGKNAQEEFLFPDKHLAELNAGNSHQAAAGLVDPLVVHAGSNQWATNKTADSRAILANDMHLPLAVPGIWYQAALQYADVTVKGITLPGLPAIVAGSNGSIAWGFTNAQTDALDLALLNINPQKNRQYKSPQGWLDFETSIEVIKVKGAADHHIMLKRTIWGPVSPELLMGKEVAIRWIAFDPEAVNMDLADMATTRTIDAALTLLTHAGLPALNAMVVDNQGHIAWTLTGKIPKRFNFDGSTSVSWGNGQARWDGYVAAEAYPRVIDPQSGFLVTANNRVLSRQHNFNYGRNFANSYRAFRITEQLKAGENLSVEKMHTLQLDTRSEFYEYYRQLALSVLTTEAVEAEQALGGIKLALENWDGYANVDSVGFGVLTEFRQQLADKVFSAYLQQCRALDSQFKYRWFQMDTPLQSLLSKQLPETLPGKYTSWNDLVLTVLKQTATKLEQRFPGVSLPELAWGDMEAFHLQHPFSHASPWLGVFLNMPSQPLAGCVYCVRVAKNNFGASMRFAVSPGYEEEMVLVESTGQSGHPFSPHYSDQYYYWVNGLTTVKQSTEEQKLLLLAN